MLTIEELQVCLTGLDAIVRRDGIQAAAQTLPVAEKLAAMAKALQAKPPEPEQPQELFSKVIESE